MFQSLLHILRNLAQPFSGGIKFTRNDLGLNAKTKDILMCSVSIRLIVYFSSLDNLISPHSILTKPLPHVHGAVRIPILTTLVYPSLSP
jgi:hypothetical protein